MNQCSLCERITWQKLAFCNPLKPSWQNKKRKKTPSFKQKDEVKIRESQVHFILFNRSKWIWCFLYINQSISLTVHQQHSQVMNDLFGKKDTFNAHKTAHSLATFQIYACMITPWRQAPVSAALDMTRLVLANLCRRKETVDSVCTP